MQQSNKKEVNIETKIELQHSDFVFLHQQSQNRMNCYVVFRYWMKLFLNESVESLLV